MLSGTEQIRRVLQIFRDEGMRVGEVQTGLGQGYAPARKMYEACGFEPTMEFVTYNISLD